MKTYPAVSHGKSDAGRAFLRPLLAACAAVAAGGAFASATIGGTTLTFDVAEGVTETYDEAIPTDGTITTVYKKGAGTIQLTKSGGKSGAMTIYVQAGILELVARDALSSYNKFYISSGAQYYLHSSYASGRDYATICHHIKGVAGTGPDGKGAIRLDATTTARSCFRNEVTLTGDATFYNDNDQEFGFNTGCPLNLQGHTLTIDGRGTTMFGRQVTGTACKVTPGTGGKIVVKTPNRTQILNDATFLGDASAVLELATNPTLLVSNQATLPWTVCASAGATADVPWTALETDNLWIAGGRVTYSDNIKLGRKTDAKGTGASLVIKSGTVFVPADASNPKEINALETGSVPALYKIEANAVVTNKSVSNWGSTAYTFATQNWGDYTQIGGAYLANWFGGGFFGLEGGILNVASSGYILGVKGSRGVLQQDAGRLTFNAGCYLSRGGRSDYLMRGGTLSRGSGGNFYLANVDSGETETAAPDDVVTFSMIGTNNPTATFASTLYLNSRTGMVTHVNLNAGRLSISQMEVKTGTAVNPCRFNLNGGTLVMPATAEKRLCANDKSPLTTTVYGKGFTFEVDRTERTFLSSQELNAGPLFALRGAYGRGVKAIRLPDAMPRTGYRGIVPVKIVSADGDTTGSGALAALDFDVAKGTVSTNLLILCPGCGYTAAPTAVAYGPDMTTEYACTVELTDEDQVPGAFVKTGPGELVLNSTNNTYAGPYVISNGTLMVNYNARIPTASEISVAGGCFRWDWCDRTVAKFGGWGTFFGSRNDSPNKLTVTDELTFDANDLNEGRYLSTDQNAENGKYAKDDYVDVAATCALTIRNLDALDPAVKSFALIRQAKPFSRLPAFDGSAAELRLVLCKGRTELWLKRSQGMRLIVR